MNILNLVGIIHTITFTNTSSWLAPAQSQKQRPTCNNISINLLKTDKKTARIIYVLYVLYENDVYILSRAYTYTSIIESF